MIRHRHRFHYIYVIRSHTSSPHFLYVLGTHTHRQGLFLLVEFGRIFFGENYIKNADVSAWSLNNEIAQFGFTVQFDFGERRIENQSEEAESAGSGTNFQSENHQSRQRWSRMHRTATRHRIADIEAIYLSAATATAHRPKSPAANQSNVVYARPYRPETASEPDSSHSQRHTNSVVDGRPCFFDSAFLCRSFVHFASPSILSTKASNLPFARKNDIKTEQNK